VGKTNYLLEAVNVEPKDRDKIERPEPWPRPYEVARHDEDDEPGG